MKKIVVLSALVASSLLFAHAQDYNYEITPLIGYNIPEGDLALQNSILTGAELQYNKPNWLLSPELSVLYTNADHNKQSNASTNIYRFALNGVYGFHKIQTLTPFVKAGLGYETLSTHFHQNLDSPFVDAGAGVKMALVKHVSLKLEAVYNLKNNNNRWDNNLALLAGVDFAFGGSSDQSGVNMQQHQEAKLPATQKAAKALSVKKAVAKKVAIKKVRTAKRATRTLAAKKTAQLYKQIAKLELLNIKFANDSSLITNSAQNKIDRYVGFLQTHMSYKIEVRGYTDSVGASTYNLILSQKRANSVAGDIVSHGISAKRVTAVGYGEAYPVALNSTKQGRAQNRRVNVKLLLGK